MNTTTVAVDLAKSVFQLAVADTNCPVGRAKSPTPGRVKIPHLLTV